MSNDKRILINNADVRDYRQISKQINSDSFDGHALSVQRNNLNDLLSDDLYYDFFNSLETGWTNQSYTFTRVSDTIFTATGVDLSGLSGYSAKINNTDFFIIESAVFGGADTTITVSGNRILSTTITTLETLLDTKYVNLLNGTTYVNTGGNTVYYQGLVPFLCWNWLSSYLTDASVKNADAGNVSLQDTFFNTADPSLVRQAKSLYGENALRSRNSVISYLDDNDTTYPLYYSPGKNEIRDFDLFVV